MELIDESRDASGSCTRLIVSGPVAALDPGIEVTAFRIVQEALTNARRHAPGAAVDVELRYSEEDLVIRVRDNGPGPPSTASNSDTSQASHASDILQVPHVSHVPHDPHIPHVTDAGHGLLGMRERAATVRGTSVPARRPAAVSSSRPGFPYGRRPSYD